MVVASIPKGMVKDRSWNLELAVLWNKVLMAAQVAQSACGNYLDTKHDLARSPSDRNEAKQTYVEARQRLVTALVELKVVKRAD